MTFPNFFSQGGGAPMQGGSPMGGGSDYARQLAQLMMQNPTANAGVNPLAPGDPGMQPGIAGGMQQPMTPQQAAFPSQQDQRQQQFQRMYGILNSPHNYSPEGL